MHTLYPSNSTSENLPNRNVHKDTCLRMFITAFFVTIFLKKETVSTMSQFKNKERKVETVQMCIIGDQVNKLCFNLITEYYATVKKNKIIVYRLICTDIQNRVSEKNQTAECNTERGSSAL